MKSPTKGKLMAGQAGTRTTAAGTYPHQRDRSRRRLTKVLAMAGALGLAVTLGACSAPSSSSAGGASNKTFTVALVEPDLTTVPIMAALDTVRAAGYDVRIDELAEPELAIEGLAKGDYAISAEATSPALIAIERGAPIKIIADVIGNQWALYGKPGISTCDNLSGKPVGIFSEGAVATAMVRSWVEKECKSGEPDYLVIGSSDVRAQALLNGQIDATALEISDVVALEKTAGADFSPVVNFGEKLPSIHPQTVYANADFLSNNKEAAQAFVTALIDEHKKINADPEYLVGLAEKHLGEEASPTLSAIAARYVEAGLFDAGALTQENVQGTIDFFVDAGVIKGLDASKAADLSFLGSR
ncbi:ABC transporter substrate-binding protein [Arthrobacter sp.]|uniref:ABC transporter substrate-binding protein n=1 Tax=Arthrobacter sp. TaxID=1667 RepID=UPI00281190D2|nr:ABC transporter substrate-binding protein [Arthrobacter sp.]